MALTAANVITRAQDLIQDTTGVRWPEAELLRYLNDGRREVCIARPDLYSVSSVQSLAAGTKQAIPADGSRFLDAIRNISVDNAPGRAVRIVEREVLDAQLPDWHSSTTGATKHFMFDERTPRVFYVYPPAAAGQKLEIAYAQNPVEITNTSTELTNEDVYAGALVDYVCYRAFSKDAEYAGNAQRAGLHYAQFTSLLMGGGALNTYVSPNTSNVGGTVPRAAALSAAAGG
jgi:hypothetical protein